jgi:hypothetical protein
MCRNRLGLVLWLWGVACGFAVQQEPGAAVPLWSEELLQDLGRSGYQSVLLDSNRAGVTFLNNGQLVVYEVDHVPQLSSRESPEVSSPFRLHVSLLDPSSGKLAAGKEWGTRLHDSAVQATTGGLLVKTGGIVRVYSPNLADARDVPQSFNPNEHFVTSVSASGETIMINWIIQRKPRLRYSHFDVVDADTLQTRYSWDEAPPLYSGYSISDKETVAAKSNGRFIVASEFGSSSWKVLLDKSDSGCRANLPTLVANDSLVVRNCGDLFLLTTLRGISYSLGRLDEGNSNNAATAQCAPYDGSMNGKTAVASGGRRVALSLVSVQIKKHLLTESSMCLAAARVVVYDLTLKKRVFTVAVDPLPTNDYDFSLSPDGSKLAVLNDRKVLVYSVPIQ